MGDAIVDNTIDFGVLAVSPSSSKVIREDLANALIRIGAERSDDLPEIAKLFVAKLTAVGIQPSSVCRALRIVTIAAGTHDGASIAAAQAEIGHLCREPSVVMAAWNALYRDAVELIDRRSRRELSALVQVLRTSGVALIEDSRSPAGLLAKLAQWTIATSATFSIFGVVKPLRLSEAWIPLHAIVREERSEPIDLMAALTAYQAWHDREYSRDAVSVDPQTLGRFIKLVVLVAGPGMGKTTLIGRIAQAYAIDGIPVLRVRLAAVAARMRAGDSFTEAVFALGLDGSQIAPSAAMAADIANWVLLCDGLDETGNCQAEVAAAAERFAHGHAECRVIVTTRPVGYHASAVKLWRHYDIIPLERTGAPYDLARLLVEIGGEGSDLAANAYEVAKAELADDAVAKVVARSPLLLGLAASVIARGSSLGASRNRLYEQLFALVDEAPVARIPMPSAEAPVLRRFLDALGWHVVADPVASVEATLDSCAKLLVSDLGMKPLAARAAAETYLRYWQDVGLIERVGIAESETLTFIHKTFGEFAASRFLTAMPNDERRATLAQIGGAETWHEVLDFAAMRGIADEVCALLLQGVGHESLGIERLVRSLDLLSEVEAPPSEAARAAIFDAAVAVIRSPRRHRAARVGSTLLPAARRFPREVAPRCAPLVSEPESWTRLAAWATLVAAAPASIDPERLRAALEIEPPLAAQNFWPNPGGGLSLSPGTERELAGAFILDAARLLLERHPGPETDKAIDAACRLEGLGSIDFLERATRLLVEFGKPADLWPTTSRKSWNLLSLPPEYGAAQRNAYAALFDAIDPARQTIEPAAGEAPLLLTLAAFLQLTGYWDLSMAHVWDWQESSGADALRETARAAIAASGLSREALEHEVRIARGLLAEQDSVTRLYRLVAEVDVHAIDWPAAALCDPDIDLLEAALYHRAIWVVWNAASLIDALAPPELLERIVRRAIAEGGRHTLRAAAALAGQLDKDAMVAAIYDRLLGGHQGCEHLILALGELEAPVDARLCEALEVGFFKSSLEVAMACAKVAAHLATPQAAALDPILARAADHWREQEEPYPQKGGVIPESPRRSIAEARAVIAEPGYAALRVYVQDSRSDLREFGERRLIERLAAEPGLAPAFLTDIEEQTLAASVLDKALTAGVEWDGASMTRVKALLVTGTRRQRYGAMAVLASAYETPEVIRNEATRLTADPDLGVKERAYRILDTLAAAP
ncbi:hypothetical protein [Nitrobacter sp.]|uniref:NACHT domain-containing protein n=1 Tax=Nitrobacter sp. TaxID=29420 RepID=UPI002624837B|nr:hypothetical protein [Nitrobacter sp.]